MVMTKIEELFCRRLCFLSLDPESQLSLIGSHLPDSNFRTSRELTALNNRGYPINGLHTLVYQSYEAIGKLGEDNMFEGDSVEGPFLEFRALLDLVLDSNDSTIWTKDAISHHAIWRLFRKASNSLLDAVKNPIHAPIDCFDDLLE
jgi:hypothetical protein